MMACQSALSLFVLLILCASLPLDAAQGKKPKQPKQKQQKTTPPPTPSPEVEVEVDVDEITIENWKSAATGSQKLFVVLYKNKDKASIQKANEVLVGITEDPEIDEEIFISKSGDAKIASSLSITAFPAFVFMRENFPVIYDGEAEAVQILSWLALAGTKSVQQLNDDSFEHLTQASTGATTGDWLVAFYKETCQTIVPVMDSVGVRIRQKTNVAVVDVSKNTALNERFAIKKCPEIILFKQGKMYRYEVDKLDQASLRSFVYSWYKNSKSEVVLPPKTKFDLLTESVASYIKTQLQGENRKCFLCVVAGSVGVFLLLTFCCCCRSRNDNKKFKYE